MKPLRTVLALACLGLLLAACNTGGAPKVASITISAATTSITAGSTEQFSAVAKDSSGNTIAKPNLTWHSSNTSVATINGSGLAKGVAAGTTSITATYGNVTSNAITLTVQAAQSTYTPNQTGQAVGQQSQALNTVAQGLTQSPAFTALGSLPPGAPVSVPLSLQALLSPQVAAQALHTLASSTLPRGVYHYDSASQQWVKDADSANTLELKWSYQKSPSGPTHPADLLINWAVSSATVTVSDGAGNADEVPTSMNISLTADGTNQLADINLSASWYDGPPCSSAILEPSSLAINGYLGDASAKLSVDANLTITDNDTGSDSISTKGTITASAGADSASFNWDVTANGTISRGSNCFINGFTTTDGHVGLGLSSTVSGETHSLALAFDFSNIVLDASGNLTSVDLTNGSLTVDNQVAVTFAGTLDDANGNGTPGDNVTLTFAGGQTETLEAFLQDLQTTMSLQRLGRFLLPLH